MAPLVAPAGTTALILAELLALTVAWMPSIETTVAWASRLPTMITMPPTGLDTGLNLEIPGPRCMRRSLPDAVVVYVGVDVAEAMFGDGEPGAVAGLPVGPDPVLPVPELPVPLFPVPELPVPVLPLPLLPVAADVVVEEGAVVATASG